MLLCTAERGNPPVAMHIDTPILREQVAHEDEAFVDHGDEGVRALAPGVAVGDLFQDVGLLGEGVAADLDVHGEIGAHVKGRVDVDQLEAALLFDLLAQRAVLEDGEDQLVVAPDELVGPALESGGRGVIKQTELQLRYLLAFRRAARPPARSPERAGRCC